MNWPCRSTKIFAIVFLIFEIYCIVPKKLGDILFHIVSPQTMSYNAQMQYMYDFLQTLFHTAVLDGKGTVMKISTKCNRCGVSNHVRIILMTSLFAFSCRLAQHHTKGRDIIYMTQ